MKVAVTEVINVDSDSGDLEDTPSRLELNSIDEDYQRGSESDSESENETECSTQSSISSIAKRRKTETKVGRKKDPIWEKFEQFFDSEGNLVAVKCKQCNVDVSKRPNRMQNHLSKCAERMKKKKPAEVTVWPTGLPASSCSLSTPRPMKQTSLHNWTKIKKGKSVAEFNEKMDRKIGKFFFGCNIPFRKVQSDIFRDMMKTACQDYTPPSAKRLSTTILNKEYNDCTGKLRELLNGKKAVIMQDGWSTNQNVPVIAHCLHVGTQPVFFNAVVQIEKQRIIVFSCLKKLLKRQNQSLDARLLAL